MIFETFQPRASNLRMALLGHPGCLVRSAFHLCTLSHLPLTVLALTLGSGLVAEAVFSRGWEQKCKVCGERGMEREFCEEEQIEAINI